LDINYWQLGTWILYLLASYWLLLISYRLILPGRRISRALARLKAMVEEYFPPTA
jgi:hypothetical protein